jgi:hypothetical protein
MPSRMNRPPTRIITPETRTATRAIGTPFDWA